MNAIVGVCKFCGCTEDRPCLFDRGAGLEPCAWLTPNIWRASTVDIVRPSL